MSDGKTEGRTSGGTVPVPGRTQPGALSRTQEHALSIEDLGLATGSADSGLTPSSVVQVWFQLFKTAQIHTLTNEAIRRPIQHFVEVVNAIVSQDGRLSLQSRDRSLYVNSVKVKMTNEEQELAGDVLLFFDDRGLGGFSVAEPLTESQVETILEALVYAPPAARQFEAIDAALAAAAVPFRVNRPLKIAKSHEEVVRERRELAFLSYAKLTVFYAALLRSDARSAARRQFMIRKVDRTVQALVDLCLADPRTFRAVSTAKSDDYAVTHAVNVTILSLLMGQALGLSKVELAELGMAALFSDIGMPQVDDHLLDKHEVLSAREKGEVEKHRIYGTEWLLDENVVTRADLTKIVVVFEHHTRADASPYLNVKRTPDLFSRIVAITDTYDALTSSRPWRRALPPDEAMMTVLRDRGRFDAVLLKVFVSVLGLRPVGSLIRLYDARLAVVIECGGEGERIIRPLVALIDEEGRPGETVDLAARDTSGRFLYEIAHYEDPARYGLTIPPLLANAPVA